MYFPFVGLCLAISWTGALLVSSNKIPGLAGRVFKVLVSILAICALPALAWGTHIRNQVWSTEETLWLDATIKSPLNGRALMNYGLTLMAKGDYQNALAYFERALPLTPSYSTLETNLGVANAALRRDVEAEKHFQRSIQLTPEIAVPYYFYGRWLNSVGRVQEAIDQLKTAIEKTPSDFESRYLLMQIYADLKNIPELKSLVTETLKIAPFDAKTRSFSDISVPDPEINYPDLPRIRNLLLVDAFIDKSLKYYEQGRFSDSINAAQKALKIDPKNARAYNNIGAAYASLGQFDKAIEAQENALKISPDFELAKNNLAWAKSQMEKQAKSRK
jgi:tetratricopeptide (TPR) repeat protein